MVIDAATYLHEGVLKGEGPEVLLSTVPGDLV